MSTIHATLVRSVRFAASHRYRRPGGDPADDRLEFGSLADEHDHDYRLTVHVGGPVDDDGFVVDLRALDHLLEEIVGALRGRSLNDAVPAVAEGRRLPSCETVALWIRDRVEAGLPEGVRVESVRVDESGDLGAIVRGSA